MHADIPVPICVGNCVYRLACTWTPEDAIPSFPHHSPLYLLKQRLLVNSVLTDLAVPTIHLALEVLGVQEGHRAGLAVMWRQGIQTPVPALE